MSGGNAAAHPPLTAENVEECTAAMRENREGWSGLANLYMDSL